MKKVRHHYIPRFYLERFCNADTGLLSVYASDKVFKSKPSMTGFQNNYYSLDWISDDEANALEDIFMKFESNACSGFNIINKQELPDGQERYDLSIFIGLLLTRVPSRREIVRATLQAFIEKFIQESIAVNQKSRDEVSSILGLERNNPQYDNILDSFFDGLKVDVHNKASLPFVLHGTKIGEILHTMRWQVFVNNTEYEFVTSDDPVLNLRINENQYGNGIGWKDSVLLFPLSPRQILVASWSNKKEGFFELKKDFVRKVNKEIIIRSYANIYASHINDNISKLVMKYADVAMNAVVDNVGPYMIFRHKLTKKKDGKFDKYNYEIFQDEKFRIINHLEEIVNMHPTQTEDCSVSNNSMFYASH